MSTVFYSWQSDLPETRSVIETALERAIRNLNRDLSLEEALRLDQDTQGVAGWPEITTALFDKIVNCEVFVADITPINGPKSDYRLSPNPNVLLELGYALGTGLGRSRIICVINTYCLPNDDLRELPFDLRGSRPLRYRLPDQSSRGVHSGQEDATRTRIRRDLSARLEESLLQVLRAVRESQSRARSDQLEDNLTPESRAVLIELVAHIDRDSLPHYTQSDVLERIRAGLHMTERDFVTELSRLDRAGYVEFEHGQLGSDRCRIGARGVILALLHSDYQQFEVAYREAARIVNSEVAAQDKQLSVGDIVQATGQPALLVNAILDAWDESGLIKMVRTMGGIESDTVWHASPLLEEEAN